MANLSNEELNEIAMNLAEDNYRLNQLLKLPSRKVCPLNHEGKCLALFCLKPCNLYKNKNKK
jgi:hypothetical protein